MVTFSPEFEPRVRLWLPKSDLEYSLDLDLNGAFIGGILTAESEPSGGTEQLKVTMCDPESKKCVSSRALLQGEELVELK